MLNKLIRYGLYLLVFLTPLFFLPLTVMPVIINKQMLVSVFVFLLFILWMLKIMSEGNFSLNMGLIGKLIVLLVLTLGASALLSVSKAQSLWGMNFESGTFYSFVLYALIFFLFANLVSKEQIKTVLKVFLLSSGVLSLLFLIQTLSGQSVFLWEFTQSIGFNPVGSNQGLGMFLGGALVVFLALRNELFKREKEKIVWSLLGLFIFTCLVLINNQAAWLGIIVSLSLVLWKMLREMKGVLDNREFNKFILPLFIFVFSLISIQFSFAGDFVALPVEISLTSNATFDIVKGTLAQSTKNLVLGSGPATFAYQHSLLRGIGLNLTDFWQVQFEQGGTAFLTFLTCFGLLGSLILLSIMGAFFYQSLKKIKNNADSQDLAVIVGGTYFLVAWLVYSTNLCLMFAAFLMFGLWLAGNNQSQEFIFTQSPQKAFFIMFLGVVLIVGSIMGLYEIGQKYVAALNYAQGLGIINVLGQESEDVRSDKLNQGMILISKAAQLDPKDVYLRNLSEAFLIQINQILNNESLEEEQKKSLLQRAVSNAEVSATNAVQINPANSQNLMQLASVYENLAVINVGGAKELAVASYQEAEKLDPQNPLIPFNIARIYFADEKVEEAKQELQKSLSLKSDFQSALNLLEEIEKPEE